MKEHVVKAFEESAEVKRRFAQEHADRIVQVARLITQAFREGHKVLLFGNGGSSTDASHIAAEFVGRYKRDRMPLPAIALGTDMAALTCIANDYDFAEIFARQVHAHGKKGDIAIAISTSGNSPNVLKAVEAAKAIGLVTIAWTGGRGGKLAGLVDHAFVVPSTVTARIQESHITLGHVLCELIEEGLFASQDPAH
jgi:D-sedoheptulose 7-phosphate isomerase